MAVVSVPAAWNAGSDRRKPASGVQPVDAVSAPETELTNRGTRVLAALAVAVAVLAMVGLVPDAQGSWSGADGLAGQPAGESFAYRVVSVRPGDSLWSIAQRAMSGADPRDAIANLRSLNGVSSGDLQPGQKLMIPRPGG